MWWLFSQMTKVRGRDGYEHWYWDRDCVGCHLFLEAGKEALGLPRPASHPLVERAGGMRPSQQCSRSLLWQMRLSS